MAYFKIGSNDYSMYTNELKININTSYRAQTNAAGDTVVDNQKSKRTIEVGIIPLNDTVMKRLMADIAGFQVRLSFRNPATGNLESKVLCIIPSSEVEYYTIRVDKVQYKAFSLKFTEL